MVARVADAPRAADPPAPPIKKPRKSLVHQGTVAINSLSKNAKAVSVSINRCACTFDMAAIAARSVAIAYDLALNHH